MPGFSYVAVDQAGKEIKGSIDAENSERVAETLRRDGLLPLSIKEQGVLNKEIDFAIGKKVKPRDLSVFLPSVCQYHRGWRSDERGFADACRANRE